jgi:hypothetical protein
MVICIQGWAIEYVSPVFFGFLKETAGVITTVESLMAGAGMPVHLMIR